MPTYRAAEADVIALLAEVVRQDHADLAEVGVTFLVQMVHADVDEKTGELKGPALKHHGYPALAVVSVVKLKDRVAGFPDARILIDADDWQTRDEDDRAGLLSHEIEHIVLVRNRDGEPQCDDIGRPKLKIRQHDWNLGGFFATAEKRKKHAPEVRAFASLHHAMVQKDFGWR